MKKEELDKKDNCEKINKILIILIIILLLIIFLILISFKLGKIGRIETSTNAGDLIVVSESDINWDLIEQLNIFKDFKRISPGSNDVYKFKIANTTNHQIIYDIQIREINKHNVNMRYKMKNRGKYIVGDEETSLDGRNINVENIILAPNAEEEYELFWKWEDSPNDTQIGMLSNAEYVIRIKIGAEHYFKN